MTYATVCDCSTIALCTPASLEAIMAEQVWEHCRYCERTQGYFTTRSIAAA